MLNTLTVLHQFKLDETAIADLYKDKYYRLSRMYHGHPERLNSSICDVVIRYESLGKIKPGHQAVCDRYSLVDWLVGI